MNLTSHGKPTIGSLGQRLENTILGKEAAVTYVLDLAPAVSRRVESAPLGNDALDPRKTMRRREKRRYDWQATRSPETHDVTEPNKETACTPRKFSRPQHMLEASLLEAIHSIDDFSTLCQLGPFRSYPSGDLLLQPRISIQCFNPLFRLATLQSELWLLQFETSAQDFLLWKWSVTNYADFCPPSRTLEPKASSTLAEPTFIYLSIAERNSWSLYSAARLCLSTSWCSHSDYSLATLSPPLPLLHHLTTRPPSELPPLLSHGTKMPLSGRLIELWLP